MGRAGIDRDTAERIMGHRVGTSVEAIYDRGRYDEPKRIALQKLADLVAEIIGTAPDKVVRLRA